MSVGVVHSQTRTLPCGSSINLSALFAVQCQDQEIARHTGWYPQRFVSVRLVPCLPVPSVQQTPLAPLGLVVALMLEVAYAIP
jgi:hypothetical protein